MIPARLHVVTIAVALLAGPSCDEVESPSATCPPTFATASGPALYVSGACGSDAGDGSQARPLQTLSAAAKQAQPGQTILVGSGIYSESVSLKGGVNLIGFGAVTIAAPGIGVAIQGPGKSTVAGLRISAARGTGLDVQQTALRLEGVSVEGTVAASGGTGSGIRVVGSPSVDLSATRALGNAGYGVELKGCGPVSIIDPLFHVDPRGAGTDTAGIIDPLFLPHSEVSLNAGGGVAIIDPLFAPTPDSTQPDLLLAATRVANNGRYGLLLVGASAAIQRSSIGGTFAVGGSVADGISIQAGAQADRPLHVVLDKASVIHSNGRAGIMAAAAGQVVVDGVVSGNAKGGAWANGPLLALKLGANALLIRNSMVGAAVAEGAQLSCVGARIAQTQARKVTSDGKSDDMADGIGIYGQSSGQVLAAKLDDNARAGVVAMNCSTDEAGTPLVHVADTAISGSKYQVVVKCPSMAAVGAPKDVTPPESGGTGTYADGSSDDFVVQTSPCDDGSPAEACQ